LDSWFLLAFHGNQRWKAITIEQFVTEVDVYIRWYNEKRIKISLGSLSPVKYRQSLGLNL
jgi:transposase InsO family protein